MAALDFPSSPSNGDTYENYIYDSTAGVWRRVVSSGAIDGLSDVTITTPSDGQALVYDGATSEWVNETPASTVTSLTDTTISSPADGDVLKYNGSAWVNEPTVINTDGDPGTKIYVGTTDPSGSYSLEAGDIWIEV